jgi:hypothetical protein
VGFRNLYAGMASAMPAGETGLSLCRALGLRRGNVENAGTLRSTRVGNGEGEVSKGVDTELSRRIRNSGGLNACLQRAVGSYCPRPDKLVIDTWECNPLSHRT